MRWEAGEPIVLRSVRDQQVRGVRALTVVADRTRLSEDAVAGLAATLEARPDVVEVTPATTSPDGAIWMATKPRCAGPYSIPRSASSE